MNGDAATTTVEGVNGTKIDEIVVEIDYAIIEHFSQHLYTSPNKAIEELVSNSFDALATVAYVYVPGPQVQRRAVVWDDGESMDSGALHGLWQIARSPKDDGSARVAESDRVAARKLIGKFGIGKLASYQVGQRISHLCKTGDEYLLVTIDYREILTDGSPGGPPKKFQTPIVALDADAARAWVDAQFIDGADARDQLWDAETWTLAVIDELRNDVTLPPGRLEWVLSRSMPIRPDFEILVNDKTVEPKWAKDADLAWELDEPKLVTGLQTAWANAKKDGVVGGDLVVGLEVDVDGAPQPAIQFPSLGIVRAKVSLYEKTLNESVASDRARSHGFFLMVRDRLINADDPLLMLDPPSYGTFYRAQFVLWIDDLDQDLLADRERLRKDNPRIAELTVLQEVLYLEARSEFDRLSQQRSNQARSESLLPTQSRELFREPLTALLLHYPDDMTDGFELSTPRIERVLLATDLAISDLDPTGLGFRVNANHPFFKALSEKLGGGKKAQDALRALDVLAVGDRLLEGHLLDRGITPEEVDAIMRWRDDLLRLMADRYSAIPEEVVAELIDTSYSGDKEFERAIAKIFNLMGFVASRDGASGHKDVLVVSPTGESAHRFTVEGKGSGAPVANDAAEISGAAAHRDKVDGATHAIVVAREFVGFSKENPAILKECESVGGVSIVTVDTLVALYRAVTRFVYPLDMLLPVLATIESPVQKLARVHTLENPIEKFDFRRLLDEAWKRQQDEAFGDVVPYRAIWQEHFKDELTFTDFQQKVIALETFSGGLIRVSGENVTLVQAPGLIAAHIDSTLGAED
jgi:Histidine kinase-, DNA gyrase B-, and HSP90-like ATPase